MNRTTRVSFSRVLQRQVQRIQNLIERHKTISRKYSTGRLIFFTAAVLLLYFAAGQLADLIYGAMMLAATVIFIFLMYFHRQHDDYIERLEILKSIKEEHLARMNLDWEGIPYKNSSDTDPGHVFADDLNIGGQHSLLHLLDSSIYEGSNEKLKSWLLQTRPGAPVIKRRQQQVMELIPLMMFRDRLQTEARYTRSHTSDKDWTMQDLLNWLKKPSGRNYTTPLIILSGLSAVNITMALLALAGIIAPWVIIPFILYLSYYNLNSDKISGLFDASYQMDKLLGRFSRILSKVENFRFRRDSQVAALCKPVQDEGKKPSEYLKKVSRLASAASLQKNQVLWPLVNMVLPWDMYFARKLDRLKPDLHPRLDEWLDVFYELEALNSLAGFADLNPDYTFPEIKTGKSPVLEAKQIGHPLIPAEQKVTNDFKVEENGTLFLITGSNMAGKSTFLRTIGINLCLAFAGAPVNAASFRTQTFRLFSSINVTDSLDEGFSHFYAEVRKLRSLMNELNREEEVPLYFLVDEIYRGTNNKERYAGSKAFLKAVARRNGVGMITTHDLELAAMESEIPLLHNRHFEETIKDGKMSFEYKLRQGPCRSTNALKIMEMEGLPVE